MLLLTKALLQIPTLLNNVQANRHLLWILQEWGPSWDCTWETGYWPLKLGLRGWESLPLRSSKTFCKPFQNCIVSHSFYLSFGSKASSDRMVCSWIILIQIHWYTFQAILVFMWKSSGSKAPLTKWTLTVTMMILWLM